MAIEIIPDKICKRCGGNEWKIRIRNGITQNECACCSRRYKNEWARKNKDKIKYSQMIYRKNHSEKSKASIKKWRLNNKSRVKQYILESTHKQITQLSDRYIKMLICNGINAQNKKDGIDVKIKFKDIPQEAIEKYRRGIEIIRVKNQKVEEMNKGVTTKNMTKEEKSSIYQKRHYEKKKAEREQLKLTKKEYENLAVMGKESVQEVVQVTAPAESIEEEFRRIEARRNEILYQVELLNNYIETLKIKLV